MQVNNLWLNPFKTLARQTGCADLGAGGSTFGVWLTVLSLKCCDINEQGLGNQVGSWSWSLIELMNQIG
jgi:hypothetical protein